MINLFEKVEKKDTELSKLLNKHRVEGSNTNSSPVNGFTIENRVVLVTPELAKELLKRHVRNRPLKSVSLYARQMLNGTWGFDANPICFDVHGHLLNGNNRLNAIVLSGVSVILSITTGMDPESFNCMDICSKRSGSDTAYLSGIKNYTIVFTVVRNVNAYYNRKFSANKGANRTLTNAEFMPEYLLDADYYDVCTSFAVKIFKETKNRCLSSPEIGSYRYIFGKLDDAASETFLKQLYLGDGINSKDIVYKLRELLLTPEKYKRAKLTGEQKTKMIVYVWNAIRTGVKLKTLEYPEDFDGVAI